MRNGHTQGYNGRIRALIVINKQSLINVLPSFVICKRSICTTCGSSFGLLLRGEGGRSPGQPGVPVDK